MLVYIFNVIFRINTHYVPKQQQPTVLSHMFSMRWQLNLKILYTCTASFKGPVI